MVEIVGCPVKDLISFDALENPPWHRTCSTSQPVTVKEMITKIAEYRNRWDQATKEHVYNGGMVKKVKEQFVVNFIFHVNKEEEHGLCTRSETKHFLRCCSSESRRNSTRLFSLKEQETLNLRNAYENLVDKIEREERTCDYGLLEASLLQETHRLILQDVPLPKGFTKPGTMSNKPRVTEFRGEIYHYAHPEDMEIAVINLLDKYNFLFDFCTKDGLKSFEDLYNFFKTCAWTLMELLDLHPFSDGNGRLCRILCSYSLSKLNPFPTPIYNVWTDSSKDDYIEALVQARTSPGRHPCALTTMIIECSYYGWQNFFRALHEETMNTGNSAVKCVSPSCKNSLADNIFSLPCLANIEVVG